MLARFYVSIYGFVIFSIFYDQVTPISGNDEVINFDGFSLYRDNKDFTRDDFYGNKTCRLGRFCKAFSLEFGDYLCNLSLKKKEKLCRRIFPILLQHVMKQSQLPPIVYDSNTNPSIQNHGNVIKVEKLDTNNGKCFPNIVEIGNESAIQNMYHCVFEFEIWTRKKFITFYVSRTYGFRMPLFVNNFRNVFVYQTKNEVDEVKKKWNENSGGTYFYLSNELNQIKPGDLVKVVGVSNEFNLDKLK